MPTLPPVLTLAALAELLASTEPVRPAQAASEALGQAPAQPMPIPGPDLLLAHATGLGPELPPALARRLLLLKAHELSRLPAALPGAVGRLLNFFSRDVWPVVYALGAPDSRAAHAHLCLPLLGLGEVNYQGYRLAAADVLGLFGWEPLALRTAAEALGLLGGQAFTLAYATEALARAEALERAAAVLAEAAGIAQLPDPATTPRALPASRHALEAALAAQPLPFGAEAAPAAADLGGGLAGLAEAAAALAGASAQRTSRLVARAQSLGHLHRLQALPQAAASLAQLAQPQVATSPLAAAAEALRVVEAAEQTLGVELAAVAEGAHQGALTGSTAALGVVVAAFQPPSAAEQPNQPLAPTLHRAIRFVREYGWPAPA